MNSYVIASLSGADVIIDGIDFQDALNNLCEREKDNGSLVKTRDSYRNWYAVAYDGFTHFNGIAIKQI